MVHNGTCRLNAGFIKSAKCSSVTALYGIVSIKEIPTPASLETDTDS